MKKIFMAIGGLKLNKKTYADVALENLRRGEYESL